MSSLADTHESYFCHHTGKEWPNTRTRTYEDMHTQKKEGGGGMTKKTKRGKGP